MKKFKPRILYERSDNPGGQVDEAKIHLGKSQILRVYNAEKGPCFKSGNTKKTPWRYTLHKRRTCTELWKKHGHFNGIISYQPQVVQSHDGGPRHEQYVFLPCRNSRSSQLSRVAPIIVRTPPTPQLAIQNPDIVKEMRTPSTKTNYLASCTYDTIGTHIT